MNVFESIGLTADPFSTSPSIELFYNATRHKQCLEGLELAIRMKRGLSVVRGGIGVGKTTLSRKLIENFKSETDVFEFHLMLDPKFESELELLKHIIELFGIENSGDSVQENRNIIENHLLKVGVDDGKILTLIVDEGQNMPENMLDVFRTLLNFEANDYKLLQLIIFGQPEMGSMIKKYPNFEDRISFDFELGPLSLNDTTGFIHHRMEHVNDEGREWFSQQVIENIYKKTGGYPRKITQVCHELLLSILDTEIRTIDLDIYNQVFSKTLNVEDELLDNSDKKEYSNIAVNKLLDVLRHDSDSTEDELLDEPVNEDDWIGAQGYDKIESKSDTVSPETESTSPEFNDESSEPTESEIIGNREVIEHTPAVIKKSVHEPIEKVIIDEKEATVPAGQFEQDVIGQDTIREPVSIIEPSEDKERAPLESVSEVTTGDNPFGNFTSENKKFDLITSQLPDPGRRPFGKDTLSIFAQRYVHGFSVDNGKFRSVILMNNRGKKKVISSHRLNASSFNSDALQDPNEFGLTITQFFDDSSLRLNNVKGISKRIQTIIKNRSSLSISISGVPLFSRVIKIAKDNSSKPKEIIEWAMKTNQPFETSSLKISDVHKQSNSTLIAAAADENKMENYGNIFRGLDWDINRWVPESISIFNSFTWNYPDYSTHTSIVFHLGETHSIIIACKGNCLLQIEPVHIGAGNLYETIRNQDTMVNDWFIRSDYQIPAVLLSEFGLKEDVGLYDTEFRPIIDTWRQAFNRCLTSIKKNHPIDETTKLVLSGSLSEIDHSTKYFGLAFGMECELINPFRNLELPQDDTTISTDLHPSLFTVAVGNALSSVDKVNLLPSFFEENEMFRKINKVFFAVAASIVVSLLSFSGLHYNKYAEIQKQIPSLQAENIERNQIDIVYKENISKRKIVEEQVKKFRYDIDYTKRMTEILKFLSNSLTNDIILENIRFHYGWKYLQKKMAKGRSVHTVIPKDENKRYATIDCVLTANITLQSQIYDSFMQKLKRSEIFYDITELSKGVGTGDKFFFSLRCEY